MNLRKAARGQPCQVRVPGLCDGGGETTCLAHYRLAGSCGVGMKPPNEQAAFACAKCHDEIDGRTFSGMHTKTELRLYHAEGVLRTQEIMRGKAAADELTRQAQELDMGY